MPRPEHACPARRPARRQTRVLPLVARLRGEPLIYLPALAALALASTSLPARAEARLVMLCNGGALPAPGQSPERECDSACHVGCTRPKKGSGRL